MYKGRNGITLIALVITIIVLLILAGVSLSLVTGSDGILSKAEKAVEVTKQAQLEEELQLAISELQMEYYTDSETTATTFEAWLVEKCQNSEGGVIETANGFIEVDDSGNLSYSGSNDYIANFTIGENGSATIEEIITADGTVNDVRPPVVTITGTTTNSISFTAIDTIGVVGYAITETDEQPTDWTTIESTKKYTTTVTGKTANQTYYVWAKDNAGNVSNSVTAITGEMEEASSSNISYTTTWSGTNATVTFTTTSAYTIQTSTDGSTWDSTNPITVASGTQIYVRLSDGTNGGTSYSAVKPVLTYTVAYNGNGATSGSTASSTHIYGTAKALTTNGFTRTGYTFLGWSTSSTATTATYTNGQSVTNLSSTNGATVNLYAVWKINTYTVVYNGNGSTSGSTASSSHTYGTAKTLTANGFSKIGDTFLGWSTSSTATTPMYTDGQSVTNLSSTNGGTVTLYAVWKDGEIIIDNYGDYVDLGTSLIVNDKIALEDGTYPLTDWRIFHKDETGGTYLILADYLPYSYNTTVGSGLLNSGSSYPYSWMSNTSRTDLLTRLADTSAWNKLISSTYTAKGISVTGALSLETWVASWNAKGYTKLYTASNSDGYYVGTSANPRSYNYSFSSDTAGYGNTLYFPHKDHTTRSNAYAYWLASPSAYSPHYVMLVGSSGVGKEHYGVAYFGVRPAVYLPSDIQAEKNAEGVWEIK